MGDESIQFSLNWSHRTDPGTRYALLACTKTTKTDLTPDEKRVVSALAAGLKATRKEIQ